MLVSRQAAEALDLSVGSIVQVAPPDGSRARDFRVAGIYEPTPDPSRLGNAIYAVRLHLPDVLALTSPPDAPKGAESVDAINIRLTPGADARRFRATSTRACPAWRRGRQPMPARPRGRSACSSAFTSPSPSSRSSPSTVFLVALTVMLVDERRETVGVLRLIGLPTQPGAGAGADRGRAGRGRRVGVRPRARARVAKALINRFFQWRYDTALLFVQVTPSVALTCVLIAIPLGVSATVVASWLLLRRNALRLARR